MKNLSDMLAGEHGDVDVIMTEENRLKLARMRAFLRDEEERYAEIDPYDIAQLVEDRVEELRSLSFGDEGAERLPDDILASIEELRGRQECTQSATLANINQRPSLIWRVSALVGCLLAALSVLWVTNDGSGGTFSTGIAGSLPLDKEDGFFEKPNDVELSVEEPVAPEPIRYADLNVPPTVTAPNFFSSNVEGVQVEKMTPYLSLSLDGIFERPNDEELSDKEPVVSKPIEYADLDVALVAKLPNFFSSAAEAALIQNTIPQRREMAGIARSSNLVLSQYRLANPRVDERAWISAAGTSRVRSLMQAISANYDDQNVSQLLKKQFGDTVTVDKTRSPSGVNVVVKDGEVEVHFFRIVVTSETPNPASAADSVSLSPNVFAVLQAAMMEGTSVDPTKMQVDDEIVGMVARGEGRFVAPEITFARGNNALRYSECQAISSEVQLAALANSCIVENMIASVINHVNGVSSH